MNKFNTSLIYKLVLNDECYYGSTTQKLNVRFNGHRSGYRAWKRHKGYYVASFFLFEKDFDAVKIELVESVNCETKFELETRERFWIEGNACINKAIPTRTLAEYYETNKDKYKAYFEINKEAIAMRMKEYYEANKDTAKERYEANKDILLAKHACECGGKYTHSNKLRHLKTTKHQLFLSSGSLSDLKINT